MYACMCVIRHVHTDACMTMTRIQAQMYIPKCMHRHVHTCDWRTTSLCWQQSRDPVTSTSLIADAIRTLGTCPECMEPPEDATLIVGEAFVLDWQMQLLSRTHLQLVSCGRCHKLCDMLDVAGRRVCRLRLRTHLLALQFCSFGHYMSIRLSVSVLFCTLYR